jgi:uracil-DNA glycosylase
MKLSEYLGAWYNCIEPNEVNAIITHLLTLKQDLLCPELKNIFRAFRLCDYKDLKVVALGMDPYPQKGVATGILFGNKKETKEEDISPSLQVIKEAVLQPEINFGRPHIFDNTMESWAKQGMLLINSALTTEVGQVGKHSLLWRPFIAKLLYTLSTSNSGITYMLFGNQAQSFKDYIKGNGNIILEEKHPAAYARLGLKMPHTIFEEMQKSVKGSFGVELNLYEEI